MWRDAFNIREHSYIKTCKDFTSVRLHWKSVFIHFKWCWMQWLQAKWRFSDNRQWVALIPDSLRFGKCAIYHDHFAITISGSWEMASGFSQERKGSGWSFEVDFLIFHFILIITFKRGPWTYLYDYHATGQYLGRPTPKARLVLWKMKRVWIGETRLELRFQFSIFSIHAGTCLSQATWRSTKASWQYTSGKYILREA